MKMSEPSPHLVVASIVPVEQLVEQVLSYHPTADVEILRRAYDLAANAHAGQRRKSGALYFSHPTAVAATLCNYKLDTATICAALLHDVVEDTHISLPDIERMFGPEIAFLVDGVTKLSKANFNSRQDRAAESFRKMLIAMARDVRVLIVKLCDRLDNMRTMQFMKTAAQERISRETLDIYAPLANRLGIYHLKCELEDLSFRYLYPDAHQALDRQLKKISPSLQQTVTDISHSLQADISRQGFAATVRGRRRHLYAIYQSSSNKYETPLRLDDLVTFSVVVESLSDCYGVLGAIHAHYTPIPGTIRDYIALPKPNLYQSLHTSVITKSRIRARIKIRTHEMDTVANSGIISRWHYGSKLTGSPDPELVSKMAWLRDLATFPTDISTPAEFLDSVKQDLFQQEVYVLTPKGDPRVLPKGATVIDFAYSVHTEIGHRCTGSIINGVRVRPDYVLQDGDIVDVTTDPAQRPIREWLSAAKTPRARSRIRSYIRTLERDRATALGKTLLAAELHDHGVSLDRLLTNRHSIDSLLTKLKFSTLDEAFRAVGFGKMSPATVYQALEHLDSSAPPPPSNRALRETLLEQAVRRLAGRKAGPPMISDLDEVIVKYATCCQPIPGDDIIGVISRGKGITVHRRECTAAFNVASDRRFPLRWDPKHRPNLPIDLKIVSADRPGILAQIGLAFQQHEINVESFSGRHFGDSRSVLLFSFRCSDAQRLQPLLRALRRIAGVYHVERIKEAAPVSDTS